MCVPSSLYMHHWRYAEVRIEDGNLGLVLYFYQPLDYAPQ